MTPPPIIVKCGNDHYQKNFHCPFHPIIHKSTLHQALHNLCQVEHCLPSHPIFAGGIINSSTSFMAVVIFPVSHFITTPPLYQNLEQYPPLCLFHQTTIKHTRVFLKRANSSFCIQMTFKDCKTCLVLCMSIDKDSHSW